MTANRLLIIGPSWVGDMMMAQVLFKLLHQQNPQATIDVLAPSWSLPLLERMPEVQQGIAMPLGHGQFQLKARYQLGKQLREQQYQQAFVLPNSWKSALIPFFAQIPKRTGWLGEMRYGLLNDARKLDKKRYPLMIERFAALAFLPNQTLPKPLPKPAFVVNRENVNQALAKHDIKKIPQPILAMCPGAEFGSSKRWPPDYFAAVANEKIKQGWQVWLFGSAKDQTVCEQINVMCEQACVNLAGKTTLSEAVDLLSTVDAVLTNDSGLMHISAALGKPLVAVYGSTSPDFTPPLSQRAKILMADVACRPCFKRECPLSHHQCMQMLQPKQILDQLERILYE